MIGLSFYNNWTMAKILYAIVRVAVVITGVVIAGQALETFLVPQVVYAEEGHQQKLLKQLQAGHRYKYDIKIRKSLDLQKDFGDPVSAHKTLDHLFIKIKNRIRPKSKYNKEEAIEVLKVMSRVLKREGSFEYRKNNLLINGLEKENNGKRFIDCDDYSFIYLAASEYLGLSLDPVYVPKHVFLICRLNDRSYFYWEPTIAVEKDAGYYRDWLNIAENSGYPKILNEKEFEALQLCNLGVAWYEKGEYKKAIEYFKRALRLNPKYAVAFNNLGAAYAKQGIFDIALDCYKKATNIDPNYATAFNNTGVAFYRMSYLEKAVEFFERAIEANPRYDRAYNYKVIVLIKKGERNKALKFLNEMHELKSRTLSPSRN